MRVSALASAGLLIVACTSEPTDRLVEPPKPQLARLEPVVRDQIESALAAVEGLDAATPVASQANAWGALGRVYDAYGYLTLAATCYDNARSLAPDVFEWHYYSARLARSRGDLAGADAALQAALRSAPSESAARAELGRLRLDQRLFDEALEIAATLLAEDSHSAAGLSLRAQVASQQGDWQLARGSYERLLMLQPAATRLHQPAAMACREMGDAEGARRHLAQVGAGTLVLEDPWVQTLEDQRSGVNSLLDEALNLFQRGDFAAAETLFAQAIAIDPENPRAHLDRGSALKEIGRMAEALAEFDEALRLQPDYAKASYNRGVVLAAQGDESGALAAYERALELDPKYREARFNRANVLRRGGRLEEALAAYASLIEDDPGDGAAHLGRAIALVKLGRERDALASLEESDSLFPRSPTFKNLMARLLSTSADVEVRDPARALALAQRLVAAAPTVEHVEILAMAQAAMGDSAAAIRNLKSTLEALARAGRSAEGAALVVRLATLEAGELPSDPGID